LGLRGHRRTCGGTNGLAINQQPSEYPERAQKTRHIEHRRSSELAEQEGRQRYADGEADLVTGELNADRKSTFGFVKIPLNDLRTGGNVRGFADADHGAQDCQWPELNGEAA
jgi:hypothetical protein